MKELGEKVLEKKYVDFIDLENIYDGDNRELLWEILLNGIKYMNVSSLAHVRVKRAGSDLLRIGSGVRQL